MTRREWHRLAGGSLLALFGASPGAARTDGVRHRGVLLGVQTYSFRDRPLDGVIGAMRAVGLTSCELWQDHVEPAGLSREALRTWRETVPLSHFHAAREDFSRAGLAIAAYNLSFRDDFSSAEIERGFEMARALGTDVITASATTTVVPRVAAAAARHRVRVGMHNHSEIKPTEFATPESLIAALEHGPFVAINLDIGHFTAAGFDAVRFLEEHHARIVTLHIKDRKGIQGPYVPFGQGDAPIGPVLRLLRDRRLPIAANIEFEYEGDPVREVKRCLDYCRRQLDS